eukprot:403352966
MITNLSPDRVASGNYVKYYKKHPTANFKISKESNFDIGDQINYKNSNLNEEQDGSDYEIQTPGLASSPNQKVDSPKTSAMKNTFFGNQNQLQTVAMKTKLKYHKKNSQKKGKQKVQYLIKSIKQLGICIINNAQDQLLSPISYLNANNQTLQFNNNNIDQSKGQLMNYQKSRSGLQQNNSKDKLQSSYLGPQRITIIKGRKDSSYSVYTMKTKDKRKLHKPEKIEHSYTIKDQKSKYRISVMSNKNPSQKSSLPINKNYLTTEHNLATHNTQFNRYSQLISKKQSPQRNHLSIRTFKEPQIQKRKIRDIIQSKANKGIDPHLAPFKPKEDYLKYLDETTKVKLLIIKLYEMDFKDEKVERAIFYAGARTVEECLPYLLLNTNKMMEHQFISPRQFHMESEFEELRSQNHQAQFCLLCMKSRKKQTRKTLKQINENIFTMQSYRTIRKEHITNNEAIQSDEDLEKQICVYPNKILINNKKYLQMQEEVGIIFNTYEGGVLLSHQERHKSALSMISHPNLQKTEMLAMRSNIHIDDEEQKSRTQINEDQILDMEATQRNFLDHTNQDIMENYTYHRHTNNLLLNSPQSMDPTLKQNLEIQEHIPTNNQNTIQIKLQTEANMKHRKTQIRDTSDKTREEFSKFLFANIHDQLNDFSRTKTDVNKKNQEFIIKKQTIRSINPSNGMNRFSSSKKESSNEREAQSFRSASSKPISEDEKCMICMLPLDDHSQDFNLDLLAVQLRFNEQTIFKETEYRHMMSNQSLQSSIQNNEQENFLYENQERLMETVNLLRQEEQLVVPQNQSRQLAKSKFLTPQHSGMNYFNQTSGAEKLKQKAANFRKEIADRKL